MLHSWQPTKWQWLANIPMTNNMFGKVVLLMSSSCLWILEATLWVEALEWCCISKKKQQNCCRRQCSKDISRNIVNISTSLLSWGYSKQPRRKCLLNTRKRKTKRTTKRTTRMMNWKSRKSLKRLKRLNPKQKP